MNTLNRIEGGFRVDPKTIDLFQEPSPRTADGPLNSFVTHEVYRRFHPGLYNHVVRTVGDVARVVDPHKGEYGDGTEYYLIDVSPGTERGFVLGFNDGKRFLYPQALIASELGSTMGEKADNDPTTPRAENRIYFGVVMETRGDKKTIKGDGTPRRRAEFLPASFMIKLLNNPGMYTHLINMDPHNAELLRSRFDGEVIAVTAIPEIVAYMDKHNLLREDGVVVSPDRGAVLRAGAFSERSGIPLVMWFDKYRKNEEVEIGAIHGNPREIEGKTVYVVDDMISSGETLEEAIKEVRRLGAEEVVGVVTHLKKVTAAPGNIGRYLKDPELHLAAFVATNSNPYAKHFRSIPGVHIVDVKHMVSAVARATLAPTQENVDAIGDYLLPVLSKDEAVIALSLTHPHLVSREVLESTNQAIRRQQEQTEAHLGTNHK